MTIKHTRRVRGLVLAAFPLCFASPAALADDVKTTSAPTEPKFSYIPTFHGAIRPRWEIDTRTGDQRFQVRNARFSIEGKVMPQIGYFVQLDLCDQGKIKILDAYGKFDLVKGLTLQAGQFRMPFGVEPFRAPANYYFANRSFMAKQVMNYRAVGAKLSYTLPKTPLTIEAGAFNPANMADHNVWSKTVAWSAKALYNLPAGFSLSAGYASIKPGERRANLIDGFAGWENKNWLVCAEYMYEKYCNAKHKDAHSYLAFVDWHIPVKWWLFNRWSVQARYDGMTDHYSLAQTGDDTFDAARQRVTIGSTLTYTFKAVHADFRLNYEAYTQWKGEGKSPDRFVAEIVVRF